MKRIGPSLVLSPSSSLASAADVTSLRDILAPCRGKRVGRGEGADVKRESVGRYVDVQYWQEEIHGGDGDDREDGGVSMAVKKTLEVLLVGVRC